MVRTDIWVIEHIRLWTTNPGRLALRAYGIELSIAFCMNIWFQYLTELFSLTHGLAEKGRGLMLL